MFVSQTFLDYNLTSVLLQRIYDGKVQHSQWHFMHASITMSIIQDEIKTYFSTKFWLTQTVVTHLLNTQLRVFVITWLTPVLFELIVNGETRGRTDPSSTGNGASQSTTGVALLSLYENDIVILRTHSDATSTGALVNNKWQDSCLSLWKI